MDVETDQKQQLTDKEAEILFGKKLLGTSSPQTLLSTVWLNNIEVPSYLLITVSPKFTVLVALLGFC